MINLPAICSHCGAIFATGIVGGSGGTVKINNSTIRCPKCGGKSQIPDGTYKFFENVIEVLSAPQRTLDELQKLSDLVKKTQTKEMSTEELNNKVKEELPELHPILNWVTPQTQDQKFNLSLVILAAVLSLLISAIFNNGQRQEISPEVIINNIYETQEFNYYNDEQSKFNNELKSTNKSIRVEKIGRNQLCTCGSGLKYKKCHGK